MALPELVRVKLLSDEAGAVSLTRVLVRQMPVAELLALIVSHVGKDRSRIQRVLRSGAVVEGSSRYRWDGFEVEERELASLLESFPDPLPDRTFSARSCAYVVLHLSGGGTLELPRDNLQRRRLLRRRSFWDVLLELAAHGPLQYLDYSYREKADRYRLATTAKDRTAINEATELLAYSSFAKRLLLSPVSAIDFYVARPGTDERENS
jgi:hypothetical protein